jgi:hypothetical protein
MKKYRYARLHRGDYARIVDFDVHGICEDKDKVIKIGEIVKVMDDGYYGCYDVISVKDHIKATTICLEKYTKEPDV